MIISFLLMDFGNSFNDPFGDDGFPDNQLGYDGLYNEYYPDDIADPTLSNQSFDSMELGSESDPTEEETAPVPDKPVLSMNRPINFQNVFRPISTPIQRVSTRQHLRLQSRIPPPPTGFKDNDPPFLPPPVHSDFYPFDSLSDAKTFLAHNNDDPERTWVCVSINFINRFRNDRKNEQPLYGYLIKNSR